MTAHYGNIYRATTCARQRTDTYELFGRSESVLWFLCSLLHQYSHYNSLKQDYVWEKEKDSFAYNSFTSGPVQML